MNPGDDKRPRSQVIEEVAGGAESAEVEEESTGEVSSSMKSHGTQEGSD